MQKLKKDLVSIIMPNYNGELFIEESIQSVIDQTYKCWELIICDDGSTDASTQIIKKYVDKYPQIMLINNSLEKGQSGARNTALQIANGCYIAFLDSDDLWVDNKLEIQIEFMEKNNYAMSYSWYDQIDKDGNFINSITPSEKFKTYNMLLKIPAIGHLTGMYNRCKIGTIRIPLVKRSDDLGLWLRVLKKCKKGGCLHQSLAKYRLTPNSVSSNKIKSAKAVWNILYNVENLNIFYSLYNFIFYISYGLIFKAKDVLHRSLQYNKRN